MLQLCSCKTKNIYISVEYLFSFLLSTLFKCSLYFWQDLESREKKDIYIYKMKVNPKNMFIGHKYLSAISFLYVSNKLYITMIIFGKGSRVVSCYFLELSFNQTSSHPSLERASCLQLNQGKWLHALFREQNFLRWNLNLAL